MPPGSCGLTLPAQAAGRAWPRDHRWAHWLPRGNAPNSAALLREPAFLGVHRAIPPTRPAVDGRRRSRDPAESAGMHPAVEAELADHGVITASARPELRSVLSRLHTSGLLANPLPGVYLPADDRSRLGWLRAISAWSSPHGVLHGRSAAALWLPSLDGPIAFLAHPSLRSRRGVEVSRRLVPPEFVDSRSGIRFASPAYAAVEQAGTDDGRAIVECLRQKLANQDTLEGALGALGSADGQQVRRKVVTERIVCAALRAP